MLFTIKVDVLQIKSIRINIPNRKMVSLSSLFFTTNKGIPDIATLPASTTLAKPFYIYSILLQALFLMFFIFYFALSIFRVVKKIKNYRFEEICEHNSEDEQAEKEEGKNESERNEHEKENKLVYKFDDEEEDYDQKPKEEQNQEGDDLEKEEEGKEESEKQKEESYQTYHDQNEESFIELDQKLLFMQPFLVSFIVCNNMFATDPFTIVLFAFTVISFLLFNVKKKLANVKAARVSFMVCSLLGFISFFYNDHDITT